MSRAFTIALAALVGLTIASSGRPQRSMDEAALREELKRVFDALAGGDIGFFNKHYVPEVSRFHLGGVPLDVGWDSEKAAGVSDYFSRGWRIHTDSYDVADLRIYGDFAVTAGTAIATETSVEGRSEQRDFRFTYVWMKQEGRWKEIHHHVSPYVASSDD